MGRDKARLEIAGQTLLTRQIALVRDAGAREVFISVRMGVDHAAAGCVVLVDKFPDAGPLAGIERALEASTSALLLVLAVDMPAMSAALLGRLIACCTEISGAIPRTKDGVEPLAAIYPKSAMDRLTLELGRGKTPGARWFADECVALGLARFVEVTEAESGCFASCNSPEDFKRCLN